MHQKQRRLLGLCYISFFYGDRASLTSAFIPGLQCQHLTSTSAVSPECRSLFSSTNTNIDTNTNAHTNSIAESQELEPKLESLTVKELRQVLKDSDLNRRGILSQFKLKRDLVDFLKEYLNPSYLSAEDEEAPASSLEKASTNGETSLQSSKEKLGLSQSARPKTPMGMPVVVSDTSTSRASSSPKEILFQKIYRQYPPIKDQNCTGLGENDVRQAYHPIFTDSSSGDLDIVFVGTASCTPGITRGTSCTALRLNWNRQSVHGVPGAPKAEETSSSTGGTWIFDCGECTQASLCFQF
jgi:hypothetical protein